MLLKSYHAMTIFQYLAGELNLHSIDYYEI